MCKPCSDTTRMLFGTPTELPAASTSADERFPRVTDGGGALVFRKDANIVALSAPFTGSPTTRWTSASGPSPRAFTTNELEFDEAYDQAISGGRAMFGVNGGVATPLSINQLLGAGDEALDFSPTSSGDRVFFMSNRPDMLGKRGIRLFNAQPGIVTNITPVPLSLANACPAGGLDFAPWVTPDGELLLFMAAEAQVGSCEAKAEAPHDLYWTQMQAGQQQGVATRIDVSLPGKDDAEPSLSPDLCTLYFSRLEAADSPTQHDIYQAKRR